MDRYLHHKHRIPHYPHECKQVKMSVNWILYVAIAGGALLFLVLVGLVFWLVSKTKDKKE